MQQSAVLPCTEGVLSQSIIMAPNILLLCISFSFNVQVGTRLPVEDFSTALQLYEFLNEFGPMLNLPLPGFASSLFSSPIEEIIATSTKLMPFMSAVDGSKEVKSRLSWDALEDMLMSSDPSGAFSDVLLGMLGAIRKLEVSSAPLDM